MYDRNGRCSRFDIKAFPKRACWPKRYGQLAITRELYAYTYRCLDECVNMPVIRACDTSPPVNLRCTPPWVATTGASVSETHFARFHHPRPFAKPNNLPPFDKPRAVILELYTQNAIQFRIIFYTLTSKRLDICANVCSNREIDEQGCPSFAYIGFENTRCPKATPGVFFCTFI